MSEGMGNSSAVAEHIVASISTQRCAKDKAVSENSIPLLEPRMSWRGCHHDAGPALQTLLLYVLVC